MLRINCPNCGLRDQTEFRFGGEAGVHRPARPEQANDGDWADYLFYRDNLKGVHAERWVHSYGCRRWFTLLRDTLTHEVLPCPEPGAGRDSCADGGGEST